MDIKACKYCKLVLDIKNFYIRENGKYRNDCKKCLIKKITEKSKLRQKDINFKAKQRKLLNDLDPIKKEERLKKQKNYYYNNRDKVKKWRKKHYETHKQDHAEYAKKYYQRTKKAYRERDAKRRAIELNATPKWANKQLIKEIYLNCPDDYEVDHIIPLQGKNICGLHVDYNLQYLTKKENRSKGNKVLMETIKCL